MWICNYIRGSQKVIPSIFDFTLLTGKLDKWKFRRFSLQHCQRHSYCKILSLFLSSLFPPSNTSIYSCLVKVSVPPLQPLSHDILLHLVIGIMVSSHAFFKRTKQMIVWWCRVRTVEWMWQHYPSKICDGLCGAHICICPSVAMDKQHFRQFTCGTNLKVSIQASLCSNIAVGVNCCPPRQEVGTKHFLVPKDCNIDFSSWQHTLGFLLLVDVVRRYSVYCQLDLGSE